MASQNEGGGMQKIKEIINDLKTALIKRIKQAENMASGACYLDLRSEQYGSMGRLVMHDPMDPRWPNAGRTTKSVSEASGWVPRYAEWIAVELTARKDAEEAGNEVETLTVADACTRYLKHVAKRKGESHNTYKNRESQVRQHILPMFGARPLTSVSKREVREWLNELTVTKPQGESMVTSDAAINTKRNLRTTLLAIWHHSLPDVEAPFKGIWLDSRDDQPVHKQIATDTYELANILRPRSGALHPSQLRDLLVAAMWYDLEVLSRPNTKRISVANTAFIIALYCATGCRLEEGVRLRWECVNEDEGYIVVFSVKSTEPARIIPLQDSLRPWLQEARAAHVARWGELKPKDRVIQTSGRSKMALRSTLQKKIAKALRYADTKTPKKILHGFRATFASHCASKPKLMSKEMLKMYLGHSDAYGGATDDYVSLLTGLMEDSHRQTIQLPTPDEVRAAAAVFTPANRPHWRDAFRRLSRNPEVAAKQAAKKSERLEYLRANY